MTEYNAPVNAIINALQNSAELSELLKLPAFQDFSEDTIEQILTESGRLAEQVIAPINQSGDQQGSQLTPSGVETPTGWKSAYGQIAGGGWVGVPFMEKFGGMGLPVALNMAVQETFHSASMAFGLCPMLTQAAIEVIQTFGDDQQKNLYLEKLISGEWTGTMNLTEPQAGSDLGKIRAKAEPNGDHYLLSGQKIFITYGDHDLTENIIHLVLARTPDAPSGVNGLSLFIVPKMLLDENGDPGDANDVVCRSLEHKLGIHASPTAVMAFGENGGAKAYLLGEQNAGLPNMFVMMNLARLAVGMQGVAISERACGQAETFAYERVQCRVAGLDDGAPIAYHPDVRRMLLTMRSHVSAMRGIVYRTGYLLDCANHLSDEAERIQARNQADFFIPIAKGWCTDRAEFVTSLAVQVHGGMGYIEETGVAQHFRDARITTIYEGTTGIQARDLITRKIIRDEGRVALELIHNAEQIFTVLKTPELSEIVTVLKIAATDVNETIRWIVKTGKSTGLQRVLGTSVYTLDMLGYFFGALELARGLSDQKQIGELAFFCSHFVSRISGLKQAIQRGI